MASDRSEASVLLSKASEDLDAVDALVDLAHIGDAVIGFHAQQAVEKAMKAVLAAHGEVFPWTHDLRHLLERLEDVGVHVSDELREVRRFGPWAVEYRYGESLDASLDREAAPRLVAMFVAWADQRVRIADGGDGD